MCPPATPPKNIGVEAMIFILDVLLCMGDLQRLSGRLASSRFFELIWYRGCETCILTCVRNDTSFKRKKTKKTDRETKDTDKDKDDMTQCVIFLFAFGEMYTQHICIQKNENEYDTLRNVQTTHFFRTTLSIAVVVYITRTESGFFGVVFVLFRPTKNGLCQMGKQRQIKTAL